MLHLNRTEFGSFCSRRDVIKNSIRFSTFDMKDSSSTGITRNNGENKEGSQNVSREPEGCWRGKGGRGERRRRIEMSGSKSESSGTTCANYFEKQFLAVVTGIAKSFDRYDTGSIESLQCRGTMASIQTSQCRMSRCIGQMDRCPRDDELPVQLFGCPFTKKKKEKKQKISWKRVARN